MDIQFFTPERMSEFWSMLKSALGVAAPAVMISFAVSAVGLLLKVLIGSFKKKDDKEKDYDVYRY